MKQKPVIYKREGTTIIIHPPNPTPTKEEVQKILEEVQRISWEIWRQIYAGK